MEAEAVAPAARSTATDGAKLVKLNVNLRGFADYLLQEVSALEEVITSGPLVAMVLEGRRAISVVRAMNGTTDCAEALPGTIRGDFGTEKNHNLVHASDCLESAEREIGLWFPHLV